MSPYKLKVVPTLNIWWREQKTWMSIIVLRYHNRAFWAVVAIHSWREFNSEARQ